MISLFRRSCKALQGACLACAIAFALPAPVLAQNAAPQATEDAKKARIVEGRKAAIAAAVKAQRKGPVEIKLRDQGLLNLPDGFTFVPQPEAGGILRAQGGFDSEQTIGLIYPVGDNGDWWARLSFHPEGFVKDDEAKDLNADTLLATLKEGTEEGNAERIERGFTPIEVSGWAEKPVYEPEAHRLVWSAIVRDKGSASDDGSVNYNTRALGRDGYFSLNLITGAAAIAADKAKAKALLAAISYLPGKTYGDFNAATDHVAEYGIAALIGGVALKKLGLLALGAAFALKFAKIIGLAVIGIGAVIARFFRRKKQDA